MWLVVALFYNLPDLSMFTRRTYCLCACMHACMHVCGHVYAKPSSLQRYPSSEKNDVYIAQTILTEKYKCSTYHFMQANSVCVGKCRQDCFIQTAMHNHGHAPLNTNNNMDSVCLSAAYLTQACWIKRF